MSSKIYGLLEYHVNLVQHHNGRPPEQIPAMKAFVAAWLYQNGAFGIDTVTKAVIATGVSRAEVDNALIILQADDVRLARDVLAGWETLSHAAKSIRFRVRLIGVHTVATPADRIALSKAVDPDAMFDTITPAL
jgi:hypothetical protein